MKAIAKLFAMVAMALVVGVANAGAADTSTTTDKSTTATKSTKAAKAPKTAKAKKGKASKGKSDQDSIKEIVDAAMAALRAADIDTMIVNYAEDFKSDQGGKKEMKEFLAGAKEQGFLKDIKIDMAKMVIAVDGTKATAKPIGLEGAFGALTVELTLEKRDGKWLVTNQAQF